MYLDLTSVISIKPRLKTTSHKMPHLLLDHSDNTVFMVLVSSVAELNVHQTASFHHTMAIWLGEGRREKSISKRTCWIQECVAVLRLYKNNVPDLCVGINEWVAVSALPISKR